MKLFKRIACAMLASCVMLTSFAGCGQTQQSEVDSSASSTDSQVSSAAPDSGDSSASEPDSSATVADRNIYIEDNKFMLEGEEIWLTGMNAPWQKWDDFGGGYNADYCLFESSVVCKAAA